MKPITRFEQLIAWQKAHHLSLQIFTITSKPPLLNNFALRDQLRRSSLSVPSNIAEGFSRLTAKDKIRFYVMAIGSLNELRSQLYLVRDLGYIEKEKAETIITKVRTTGKLTQGLIKTASQYNRKTQY